MSIGTSYVSGNSLSSPLPLYSCCLNLASTHQFISLYSPLPTDIAPSPRFQRWHLYEQAVPEYSRVQTDTPHVYPGKQPLLMLEHVLPEPCCTHVHPLWKPILTQLRGWWISTATDSSMARDKQLIVLPEVDNHTFFPLAYVSSHTFLSTTGVSETKMGWFHLFFSKTFMWTRGRKNWTHVLSPNYNCFYKGKKFQPRLPPEVTIEANFPGNLYMD